MNDEGLTFELYQQYKDRFRVERELIRETLNRCDPLAIEALSFFAGPHLWRGRLPVYAILTAPAENGGWGHLLPIWFKPHERPLPFYTLDNWALFALVYSHSFGPSREARNLAEGFFNVENLVAVVAGSNLLLPFLPSTQGAGLFFRHGMLPLILSILWLEEGAREAWLRLHQLGARRFIAGQGLAKCEDPIARLKELEFQAFARIERNAIEGDEAVAGLLSGQNGESEPDCSLLDVYKILFGAITLGVAALAREYENRPLAAWREWAYQEISFPYRLAEYGEKAVRNLIANTGKR